MKKPPEVRFWAKVDKTGDCWIWTGARSYHYGIFGVCKGLNAPAHRYAYELLVGPIPKGLVLDHLCKNPPCVNPAHLEPVTSVANVARGSGFGSRNAAKTHCPKGHEYSPENTAVNSNGARYCRICHRERNLVKYRTARDNFMHEKYPEKVPKSADGNGE
jgi:hypothetical protein